MSYLRVDDIEGARPRIRHAPRSLIRQQKVSQQHNMSYGISPYEYSNTQYANNNANTNQYYQYPYNQTKNIQPSQQTNNNINAYPSANMQPIPHQPMTSNSSIKNDRNYLNDVNLSQSYHQQSPIYNSKIGIDNERYANRDNNNIGYSNRDDYNKGQRVQRIERPYIMPKDAPVVNYDHYKEGAPNYRNNKMTSYNRAYGENQRQYLDIYQKQQQILQNKRQASKLNNSVDDKPEVQKKRSFSSSINTSKQMPQYNDKQKQPDHKNIFRGLGYNIITNTKFAYDMENNLKSSSSKWLQ